MRVFMMVSFRLVEPDRYEVKLIIKLYPQVFEVSIASIGRFEHVFSFNFDLVCIIRPLEKT